MKALFVGNSLLFGMGDYGMCASAPDRDYFHRVRQALLASDPGFQCTRLYGSMFERCNNEADFEAWWAEAPNDHTKQPAMCSFTADLDLIVLQMGDNIGVKDNLSAFRKNAPVFLQRIRACSPNARILWVHGWFISEPVQEAILNLCAEYGVEPVNVRPARRKENESHSGASYRMADGTVGTVKDTWITHPGDLGMQEIAERILAAIGL